MTAFGFVGGSHHLSGAYGERLRGRRRGAAVRRYAGIAEAGCSRRCAARYPLTLRRLLDWRGDHETYGHEGRVRNARLDDAARAGWLYYVAGNTQDEIARKLGVSRQTAQRLVSLAMSERLIKVRLDHPIARCMELSAALKQRYDLFFCEVAPTDPASTSTTLGIAQIAAAEMERWLRRPDPVVIGIGTGRTMRAVADQMPAMQCPQHKLVALVGIAQGRRFGLVLRCHHPPVRHRARAASPDAAAGVHALVGGARIADEPALDAQPARPGRAGRRLFRRRRLDRRRLRHAEGRLHHGGGARGAAQGRRGRRNHGLGLRLARPLHPRPCSTSAARRRRCASPPSGL